MNRPPNPKQHNILFNSARRWLLGLFGLRDMAPSEASGSAPDAQALSRMVQASGGAPLSETGARMLADVLEFRAKAVRQVMCPRTKVVALPVSAAEEDVRAVLQRERYSRYPVYASSLDDIVGVFVAKDLWLHPEGTPFTLAEHTRETVFVPDTRPAQRVLDDLRRARAQIAVVLDEFGGTAGIVTLEDLVEQVIGDINDEYDVAQRSAIETNGVLELAGSISLRAARGEYQLPIPDGEWQTLGGYAFARLGRLPRIGDRAPYPGGELEVVAMDGRRVAAVRVHRESGTGNAERA